MTTSPMKRPYVSNTSFGVSTAVSTWQGTTLPPRFFSWSARVTVTVSPRGCRNAWFYIFQSVCCCLLCLPFGSARHGRARARLDDLTRQLAFVEQVKDHRAVSAEEIGRRRSAVQTATAELEQARAELAAAGSQVRAVNTEIERSTVRAPLDTEVLQVKLRAGEFAPAAPTATPLVVLGRVTPL